MKKNKFLKFMLLVISIFCVGKSNIYAAFPESFTGVQQGSDDGSHGAGRLAVKYYGSTIVYCTEFNKATPAEDSELEFTQTPWSSDTTENYKIAAGVAAIMIKAGDVSIGSSSSPADPPENYYWGELAINKFLAAKKVCSEDICFHGEMGSGYSEYYDVATTAYNNYDVASISLSKSNLTFTREGDNYISDKINITKDNDTGSLNYTNITTNIGRVHPDGDSFTVSVPVGEVTNQVNVEVTIMYSKYVQIAQKYVSNKPTTYQSLTPKITQTYKSKDITKTISGTITPLGKLTINKVDGDNKPLSGAKIRVTGTKGYNKEFETKGQPIVIDNLEYDTYTIEEIEAPAGYIKAAKQTASLSATNFTANVTLADKIVKTIFSKLDATGKKELPGAFLEIQDLDGKVVKLCPGSDEEQYSECTWVSTNEPYVVEGLPIGKYYFVETLAPEGYVLNKEKVLFQITGNEETIKVEMKNKLNKVKISKISASNKKELPGATLEIQDEDGKVVEYCTNEKGKKNQPCIWTSTDKPYEIEGMPNGKYYLIETLAPEGYVLNKEKVEFIVNGEKAVVEVEMKNELEVKVPDTLSARSTLLIAISMFDIALGIGILTYVKKNKIEQ